MKRIAQALILMFCMTSVSHAADVVKGCYEKNGGQLRVLIPPDTCRPSELPIKLATGEIAEQLNPNLYDANGQFLGTGPSTDLFVPSLQMWLAIDLWSMVGHLASGNLYFESTDCSGQPMADIENFNRVFRNGGGAAEVKHFTGGPELLTRDGNIPLANSMLEGQSGLCEALAAGYGAPFTRAVAVTLPFTTPVALPLKLTAPTMGSVPRLRRR